MLTSFIILALLTQSGNSLTLHMSKFASQSFNQSIGQTQLSQAISIVLNLPDTFFISDALLLVCR